MSVLFLTIFPALLALPIPLQHAAITLGAFL